MDLYELGSALFGRASVEEGNVLNDAATHTYVGTATSASEDGSVLVALSDDVTLPDMGDDVDAEETPHEIGVEMPTSVAVEEGDEVLVTVYGGGTMKSPVVTGNPGWGDRVRETANNAATVADEANRIATATGQHFWEADDGAHVTQVTRDEWLGDGDTHESGPNSLWNSLGMLFRDGLNNLLALVTGDSPGVAIYDGGGNGDENVVGLFTSELVRIGGRLAGSGRSSAEVRFFDGDASETALAGSHYAAESGDLSTNRLALGSTNGDSELSDPTGRSATGEVLVDQTMRGESMSSEASLHTSLSHPSVDEVGNAYLGVRSEAQGGYMETRVVAMADNVELTCRGEDGSSYEQADFTMPQVVEALRLALSLAASTSSVTRQSAASSIATNVLRRWGGVVQMTLTGVTLAADLAAGATVTVATVPEGYRPPNNTYVPVSANVDLGSTYAGVMANGNLTVRNSRGSAIARGTPMIVTATYIAAGAIAAQSAYPAYAGSYSVTPDADGEVLPTANTTMGADVSVEPIPYLEVDNGSGGTTVSIAS